MKILSLFLIRTTLLSFFFLTVAPVNLMADNEQIAASSQADTDKDISTSDFCNTHGSICNLVQYFINNPIKSLSGIGVIIFSYDFFTGRHLLLSIVIFLIKILMAIERSLKNKPTK